jgi:molybdate transport system substrate-binding protein
MASTVGDRARAAHTARFTIGGSAGPTPDWGDRVSVFGHRGVTPCCQFPHSGGSLLDGGNTGREEFVSALFVVIVLGISTWLCGFSIFKLIAYFKDELIIVFASTSAETMIPRSMEKLEHLGVKREVVGLVIPTGFSFRAATNLFSNIVATLVIGRWVGAVDLDRAHAELDRRGAGKANQLNQEKFMSRPLKIMSTLAVEVALRRWLLPSWRAAGYEADVQWNPTSVLKERIRAGDRADVLVMIDNSMHELARDGVVIADSITPIAQAGFGLAVAAGAPRPDISTPEAFLRALLEARSIVYSRTGASGIYFAELIQKLGIADRVNQRALVVPSGFTAKHLLTGECDLAVQQISELMSVDGVEVVGPFPERYQMPTDFSVAIFADAEDRELAARFVTHLTSPQAAEAYDMGGLKSRRAPNPVHLHSASTLQPGNLHKASA